LAEIDTELRKAFPDWISYFTFGSHLKEQVGMLGTEFGRSSD